MVAADIDTNSAAVASLMTNSPKWRNTITSSLNIGANRLPAGIPSTVQHTVSAAMTSGPYVGGRRLRGDTSLGCNTDVSALRAWLRCQPVVAHNSSRMTPFVGLSASDTGSRSSRSPLCVRPMSTPSSGPTEVIAVRSRRRAARAHLSEATKTYFEAFHAHFDESTRTGACTAPRRPMTASARSIARRSSW